MKPPWAAEAFPDVAEDVRQSLRRIENSPFVTKHVSLRGFVFDVATGKLEEITLLAPRVRRRPRLRKPRIEQPALGSQPTL